MSEDSKKLFAGGIPYTASEDELRAFFEGNDYKIVSVKIITDRDTGRSRGFAFVEFETPEDANKALALDGQQFGGRPIKLSIAREMTPRGPRSDGNGGGGDRW